MESNGVYWKPIWNVVEEDFTLLLVNAAHIMAVRRRKTDLKDAEWIADLLRNGLLHESFVPDQAGREETPPEVRLTVWPTTYLIESSKMLRYVRLREKCFTTGNRIRLPGAEIYSTRFALIVYLFSLAWRILLICVYSRTTDVAQ